MVLCPSVGWYPDINICGGFRRRCNCSCCLRTGYYIFSCPGSLLRCSCLCFGRCLFFGICLCHLCIRYPALSGRIINSDTRLHIIAKYTEFHSGALIFHRLSFYQYPGCNQIPPFKYRCHPIKHMVIGFLHIICYLVLKWYHTGCIHVPGTGNQILLVCILACQLISNQVATIIQIFLCYLLRIFHRMPATRLDLSNLAPLLRRHNLLTYIGIRGSAASQIIQITVDFKCICRQLFIFKIWVIIIHLNIRGIRISRQIRICKR
ncbi:unknown [Clostridium sp. CAG:632]|nr:unknown [Clostridium sp. CAG:632]